MSKMMISYGRRAGKPGNFSEGIRSMNLKSLKEMFEDIDVELGKSYRLSRHSLDVNVAKDEIKKIVFT